MDEPGHVGGPPDLDTRDHQRMALENAATALEWFAKKWPTHALAMKARTTARQLRADSKRV